MADYLIETRSLKKYFPVGKKLLHAVDDVHIAIPARQTLGLVGESGCGKSTLGRLLLNLIPPSGGEVLFHGENILQYNSRQMRKTRQKMQIIFQDPYASLNPRMTISEVIAEPVVFNKIITDSRGVQDHVYRLMDLVGLSRDLELSYPHELDGGRRQRIVIARALSMNPEFIVCDEPVSALDVSIQAQTLNLLMDLQEKFGLTYVFITHDLSVVKHISQEIAVMYLGQIIEYAQSDALFKEPLHPYTKALLASILVPKLRDKPHELVLQGELNSPIDPKPGCRFAPRCAYAMPRCTAQTPALLHIGDKHSVACFLHAGAD